MAKRMAFLLLALVLGYFAGFLDGRRHDRNILVRAVDRVRGVAENTVGARERAVKEEIERMQP